MEQAVLDKLKEARDSLRDWIRTHYPEAASSTLSDDDVDRLVILQMQVNEYNGMGPSQTIRNMKNWMTVRCPICKDKGYTQRVKWVEDFHRWEIFTSRCSCWNRRQVENKGVITGYTFDSFEVKEQWQQRMLDAARSWSMRPTGTLFLGGQIGSGKTHIAMAVIQSLIEKEMQVKVLYWTTDSNRLKYAGENYLPFVGSYRAIPVLYIDDLFRSRTTTAKGGISEADRNIAYDILDYRCSRNMPTIITSEFTLAQICGIDAAIGSRIAKSCSPEYVIGIGRDEARNWRLKHLEA